MFAVPALSYGEFLQVDCSALTWTGRWGYPRCCLQRFQIGLAGLPGLGSCQTLKKLIPWAEENSL